MNDALPLAEIFARGDYHLVAATGPDDDWRTHAALGLCGNTTRALTRLPEFEGTEPRFYEGVLRWIEGDEDQAIRLLSPLDDEWADNLLRLILKRRISVLSQLSWQRSLAGQHNVLLSAENDPKFNIRNISFAPADLPNRPDADIHDFYDSSSPPDLYLSEMLEWHVIPPNIQELPCPIIGQTGDYDLHIQMLYPWLQVFDEVMVTDTTEYRDVARLVDVPVTTFCKPVSLPPVLPDPVRCEKDLDLVITGSLFHFYYPDKAEMVRQVLTAENFHPFFYNGFFSYRKYYPMMERSKIAIALPRHLGAIPSRGYEALAMGTVLMTPYESCQRLFTGDHDGVVPFSLANDGLRKAVEAVLADYGRYKEGAQRGMEIVRREFEPTYASSQYMRMVVFLAARPRGKRRLVAEQPLQLRSIAYKGFIQAGGEKTFQAMLKRRLEVWQNTPDEAHTLASYTAPAREMMLEYAYRLLLPKPQNFHPLRDMALQVYRQALGRFPLSLALRFNFVRAALHFGEEADIAEALSILKATLEAGMRPLTLQPLDDLMTWDYCQSFFNYRDYLQIVTEALRDGSDRRDEMKRLVFASMHYYYGRMAGEPGHFEQAATLDPGFTMYRLWQGKELIRNGDTASAVAAIPVLSGVVRDMLCAPEAWTLLQAIRNEHGLDIPDEAELHRLADRMERRTIIDEGYVGIRLGPYFRQQRLSLGRNHRGYELRKADERPGGRRLSILLSDTNGSRYPALLDSLSRQTLPRGDFEVICADIFDRESPAAMAQADTVIVFGQNEHLYNRNVGFNTGLILARGDTVAYMDRDVALPDTALADWLALAEAAGPNGVLVNPYGGSADEHSVHTVMLRRDAAIAAGGLDESAYYAGAYSGPHELVPRAQAMGWTLHALEETFGAVAPVASPHGPAAMTLSGLLHDVWPSKFAPDRTDPLRTNPDVNPLKSAAE